MTKTASKILGLSAAFSLLAATGALAQASQPSSGSAMMKQTPKSDTAKMKSDAAGMPAKADQSADTSADASAMKPKAHHRMAKNEALNEQEAETTKQLNEQQAQHSQNAK